MKITKKITVFLVLALFVCMLFVLTSCKQEEAVNKLTVQFDLNGGEGTIPAQEVVHGEKIGKPKDPTREGYEFLGWYVDGEPWSFVGYVATSDMTLTAKWKGSLVSYKVEHYKQISEGQGYALIDSQTYYGTTETQVTAALQAYVGYELNLGLSNTVGVVLSDGSLILKAYYDVNMLTVQFDLNGGEGTIPAQEIVYGEKATKPDDPVRLGYNFLGWYVDDEQWSFVGYTVTDEMTLTARWEACNVQYIVEHYKQNSNMPEYICVKSDIYYGRTDTQVYSPSQYYSGYKYNSEISNSSGIILGDGTLVLKLYYDYDCDVDAAAEYVEDLYKEELGTTAADFNVVPQVRVANLTYTITWTVDSDKVIVEVSEDGKTVNVNVDEKSNERVAYVLTATVKAPDGTTATVSFNCTVPNYNVNSHAEYMAAADGTELTVEGIVVAINSKSMGNKYNHLFLADAEVEGGYYCYSIAVDPATLGIQVGMTVSITAKVTPYSGMQELKGGTPVIVDSTIKPVEPLDITDKFLAKEDLAAYVGLPVVIRGVELGEQDMSRDTTQYLYFSLGAAKGYVRTYVTDFPAGMLVAGDKAAIDADHAAHYGYKADVTGILVLYGTENPYLIPMSLTPFTNYEEVIKTPAEKVESEKAAISLPTTVTENTTLTLPLVGKYYDDVTIAWAIDNDKYTIGADGKLAIELGDEQVTLTLTATITCGEVTDTATLTVKVDAAASDIYLTENVTAPVAGTAYKFYLVQANLGKTFYLTGEVESRYLITTDKANQAVDVYAEVVEGGYKLYILVDGVKQYITVYSNSNNKDSVKFDAEGTTVYTYNETVNAWVTNFNGTDKYLGTYSTYNTVSVSNLSYITADNTGVSQFPAGLGAFTMTKEAGSDVGNGPETPPHEF